MHDGHESGFLILLYGMSIVLAGEMVKHSRCREAQVDSRNFLSELTKEINATGKLGILILSMD